MRLKNLINKLNSFLFSKFLYKNTKILFPSFIGPDVILEGHNFIGRFCHIKRSKIGKYSYIGNSCEFSNTNIGSFCSISNNVKIVIGSHPSSDWVSTHPLFYSTTTYVGKGFLKENRFEEYRKTPNGYICEIGHDVWIGASVNILQGVSIGDGAIIGTNSLVTKDIPPYSIAVGIPARIIRKRFKEDDIELLESLQWWNWEKDRIKYFARYFKNIYELKKHL